MNNRESDGMAQGKKTGSTSLRRRMMTTRASSLKRWVSRLVVALVMLGVVSAVGLLAITPSPAEIESSAVVAAGETGRARSNAAYAARYVGLAQHYTASIMPSQRAADAYAARCQGMADHYQVPIHSSQRALDAYAARYDGLAHHCGSAAQSSQRGMDAYAARCAGLGQHYTATAQ